MTANRQFAENARRGARSQGNLGQNKAAREQAADAKLAHMGADAKKAEKGKEKKDRERKRSA